MFLFFDTETTGLPANYKAPLTDTNNWPRVIQLAFAMFDAQGNQVAKYCQLIKPDGWVMPTGEFWVKNGYSHEKSAAQGVPIVEALNAFIEALQKCQYLVAHNMEFDNALVGCEMVRAGLRSANKPVKLCTKELATNYCKLPSPRGWGYKWPTLTELHNHLFAAGFDGAHDAMFDVLACAKCFFELKNRGVIVLNHAN